MSDALATCVLCPRLCRHACPVAHGTAREAAVPTQIADVVRRWEQGDLSDELAREAATLCVDCGRCQDACHLHRPLPELLQDARRELLPERPLPPLPIVEGEGIHVACEPDDRRWSEALATRCKRHVARARCVEGLGWRQRGGVGWDRHLAALASAFADRIAVVADGDTARTLQAAGVAVGWLEDLVPELASTTRSCARGGSACCGGAGPLADHHPADARRMAARWSTEVSDTRCAIHLRRVGAHAVDAIDRLLGGTR